MTDRFQITNVNENEIYENIRKAEALNSNNLAPHLIAVFDKADLTAEQRKAICMEALISLDKRLYFGNVIRQFQLIPLFVDFGFSELVPIVEKVMLAYLTQALTKDI